MGDYPAPQAVSPPPGFIKWQAGQPDDDQTLVEIPIVRRQMNSTKDDGTDQATEPPARALRDTTGNEAKDRQGNGGGKNLLTSDLDR